MHPLIAVTLLLAAGIGALRLAQPRAFRPMPRPLHAVMAGGLPLVLAGVVLGPGLRVFDDAALHALTPLVALGAGWIGAAFGTRLEWRMMRRVPPGGWGRGAALAVPVFVLTAAIVWALLRVATPLSAVWHGAGARAAILTLAAAATVSTGLSRVKAARRAGLFDTILAATAAALAVALTQLHPLRSIVLTLLAAGLPAVLWLLFQPRSGLLLIAAVLFAAGFAVAAELSPFVVCALLTALIVSFGASDVKRFVGAQLAVWEPGVYAAFLIVVGAWLRFPTVWLLLLGVGLAALRAGLRWTTVHFGKRWSALAALPAPSAFVTVAQGAAAVALAAGYTLARGDAAVLATVVTSVLAAELIAVVLDRSVQPSAARAPLTASSHTPEVT